MLAALRRGDRHRVHPPHLGGERRAGVVARRLELVDDAVDDLGRLVLAELAPGVEAGDAQAEADGALRDPARALVVEVERRRARACALEVVDELAEHPEVLVVGEDLGHAVEVRGDVVPGRDDRSAGYQPGEM